MNTGNGTVDGRVRHRCWTRGPTDGRGQTLRSRDRGRSRASWCTACARVTAGRPGDPRCLAGTGPRRGGGASRAQRVGARRRPSTASRGAGSRPTAAPSTHRRAGRDDVPMYRRARAGIGYLPQEMSIFRGLSVEDNIMAILEVVEKDRKTRQDRLRRGKSCCPSSPSATCAARPPCRCRAGERRRAEIARAAFASNPRYVLLDEPFAGVDPIAVGDIRHLVQDLKTRGHRRADHRTTTCAKRSRSWTAPISCTTARSSSAGTPRRGRPRRDRGAPRGLPRGRASASRGYPRDTALR